MGDKTEQFEAGFIFVRLDKSVFESFKKSVREELHTPSWNVEEKDTVHFIDHVRKIVIGTSTKNLSRVDMLAK
jgi:hypothetical protein